MSNFEEYRRLGEPQKVEKSGIWDMAIGLQEVDGLKPSRYLVEVAKANIEGDITFDEVKNRLNSYYESQIDHANTDDRTEEADKVSARIAEILSEKTFTFSPAEFINIHGRLYEGFDFAGKLRDYNISKKEWVLDDDTVIYASAKGIMATLDYDFKTERDTSYKGMSKESVVNQITQFVSRIWQSHPFFEGNTRATAVFAIKYLRTFGFKVENDLFAKNSWYFRNALVIANYTNYEKDIFADFVYLDKFFGNLLLGQNNKLVNREMHISYNSDTVKQENDTVKIDIDTVNSRIIQLIEQNNKITAMELKDEIGISIASVKRRMKKLKDDGVIQRIGSDKSGHWEIILK